VFPAQGIYYGNRRIGGVKFALSCRKDPPLRVPTTSLTVTGIWFESTGLGNHGMALGPRKS
jgi:hypothetical protein